MHYENNQPSFQSGRLVVIYHDFINPRRASTASTSLITRAAARWGRRNRMKLTIIILPVSCQGQSSIRPERMAVAKMMPESRWKIHPERLTTKVSPYWTASSISKIGIASSFKLNLTTLMAASWIVAPAGLPARAAALRRSRSGSGTRTPCSGRLRQHRINAKNRIIQWVPNKNCE